MMIDVHTHALPRRVINLVEKDRRFGVDVSDGRWRSVHIAPFKITEPWYSPDAGTGSARSSRSILGRSQFEGSTWHNFLRVAF